MIRSKTGLIIDSYFSASKLQWIINNTPGAKEKAKVVIFSLNYGQLVIMETYRWKNSCN